MFGNFNILELILIYKHTMGSDGHVITIPTKVINKLVIELFIKAKITKTCSDISDYNYKKTNNDLIFIIFNIDGTSFEVNLIKYKKLIDRFITDIKFNCNRPIFSDRYQLILDEDRAKVNDLELENEQGLITFYYYDNKDMIPADDSLAYFFLRGSRSHYEEYFDDVMFSYIEEYNQELFDLFQDEEGCCNIDEKFLEIIKKSNLKIKNILIWT